MTEKRIPKFEDLLWPTLKALKACGGSASIRELVEWMASDLELFSNGVGLCFGE